MTRLNYALIALLVLTACGREREQASSETVMVEDALAPVAAPVTTAEPVSSLSTADQGRVCRAVIADGNGHDPSIVRVDSNEAGIVQVSYDRPSDRKRWTNQCRFVADRVIWRTVDAFGPGTGVGRWRESADDEVIRYTLAGRSVTISTRYPDGSGSPATLTVD